MNSSYIYILCNIHKNVIYTGCTENLKERVYQHRSGMLSGFTKKYNVHRLVYFEEFDNVHAARLREKVIKGWKRARKNELINSKNPSWCDLYGDLK
jgi:putative endonuclease